MNEQNRMNDFGNKITLFFRTANDWNDLLVIREINTQLTGLRLDK